MYAFIETGGKQFKVAAGQTVKVPLLGAGSGAEVRFDKVLVLSGESGTTVGAPYVANAAVTAEVVKAGKDRKVLVFKKLARKNHRKLRGHRQDYTAVKIKEIIGG